MFVSFHLVYPHSYSLEGLTGGQEELRGHSAQGPGTLQSSRLPQQDSDDRGSLVSLTEEQEELVEHKSLQDLVRTHTHILSLSLSGGIHKTISERPSLC